MREDWALRAASSTLTAGFVSALTLAGFGFAAFASVFVRVAAGLLALKHIALYKEEDGFDFSAHATPRSGYVVGEHSHFACAALKHYLMHGNHQQKELVCLVIAFQLRQLIGNRRCAAHIAMAYRPGPMITHGIRQRRRRIAAIAAVTM